MDSQIIGLGEFEGLAIVIGLAAGDVVLLLLLSFCLRRRWLRSRARGQIEKDVNDSDVEASEQDAVDSAEARVKPWPRALQDPRPEILGAGVQPPLEQRAQSSFKQDRIKGLPFPPMGLLRAGTPNRVLSSRARKTVDGAEAGVEPWPRAFFASLRRTEPRPEVLDAGGINSPLEQDRIEGMPRPSGLPDPSARASVGGGSGQANFSDNAQRRSSRKASIDAWPPTLPKSSLALKIMSQGKLTEAVEAVLTDRAARFRARKAPITAGDEFYEGAKGTKEGPDRSVSRSRPMRAEASALDGMTPIEKSEAAMAANIRSALNYDAGSSGSNTSRSSDGSGQTEHTARNQRVPNPPARKPDDIWVAVRARRVTAAAFNSDRRQRLQAMRQGQARLSCRHACRECSPVGETVRV